MDGYGEEELCINCGDFLTSDGYKDLCGGCKNIDFTQGAQDG